MSIFAVEIGGHRLRRAVRGRNVPASLKKEMTMRIVESAAAGLVALAVQMLVVATVLL
jgi:hypothetical protein